MKIFATRLRELRLQEGYTQTQIAEMLNIRQQSYIRYEYGTGEPSLETLAKIATIFGVTSDYLLGLSNY